MLADDRGHVAIERCYSDPSAAHERALKFQAAGAYRVTIEPPELDTYPHAPLPAGCHLVTAWFHSAVSALAAA